MSSNIFKSLISILIVKAEDGYTNLVGIDYSDKAIDLARAICEKEGFQSIDYKVIYIYINKEFICIF